MTICVRALAQHWPLNAFFLKKLYFGWDFVHGFECSHPCLRSEQSWLQWECAGAFGGHCNITTQPLLVHVPPEYLVLALSGGLCIIKVKEKTPGPHCQGKGAALSFEGCTCVEMGCKGRCLRL